MVLKVCFIILFLICHSNKENLVKELLQENGVENLQEGINPQEQNQAPAQNINVNGQISKVEDGKEKKKKCGC